MFLIVNRKLILDNRTLQCLNHLDLPHDALREVNAVFLGPSSIWKCVVLVLLVERIFVEDKRVK